MPSRGSSSLQAAVRGHALAIAARQELPASSNSAGLHTISIQSRALGHATPVNILLPQGYSATGRRYAVLYLLHGFSNSYASWAEDTDVLRFARRYPLIIVMPDGDDGWYINDADGGPRWADYDLNELIPYVDLHYRTIAARKGRAIAGLSMGGFGALSYAARRPDLFIAAASFSGALDVERLPALGFGIAAAFGLESTWLRTANSPVELAPNLITLQLLYMATGTGRLGPLDRRNGQETGAVEAALYPGFLRTVAAVRAAGAAPVTHVFSPGTHSWPYWQRDLHQALPLIMKVFEHPKPRPSSWSYKTGAASATVWGYHMTILRPAKTNGFVTLEQVTASGFAVTGAGRVTVRTAPRYLPGHAYTLRWDGRPLGTAHADRSGALLLHLPPVRGTGAGALSINP